MSLEEKEHRANPFFYKRKERKEKGEGKRKEKDRIPKEKKEEKGMIIKSSKSLKTAEPAPLHRTASVLFYSNLSSLCTLYAEIPEYANLLRFTFMAFFSSIS